MAMTTSLPLKCLYHSQPSTEEHRAALPTMTVGVCERLKYSLYGNRQLGHEIHVTMTTSLPLKCLYHSQPSTEEHRAALPTMTVGVCQRAKYSLYGNRQLGHEIHVTMTTSLPLKCLCHSQPSTEEHRAALPTMTVGVCQRAKYSLYG